jgi:hypothetical protein
MVEGVSGNYPPQIPNQGGNSTVMADVQALQNDIEAYQAAMQLGQNPTDSLNAILQDVTKLEKDAPTAQPPLSTNGAFGNLMNCLNTRLPNGISISDIPKWPYDASPDIQHELLSEALAAPSLLNPSGTIADDITMSAQNIPP